VSGFLLDTNVLSELERARPMPSVVAFVRQRPLNSLFTSEIVMAEIRFGIDRATSSKRREELSRWLTNVIRPMFAGRTLSLTEDILLQWRLMMDVSRRSGYTHPEPDLLLAATAAHHNLTMLSRDIEPFRRAGVDVVNPWLG
jgi:predicted nucleic acid-binding protein